MVDWLIVIAKCLIVLLTVLKPRRLLLWVERKGSALIQNRVGANRASIFGVLPVNLGFVNTLIADPLKLFTKEDFVPAGADHADPLAGAVPRAISRPSSRSPRSLSATPSRSAGARSSFAPSISTSAFSTSWRWCRWACTAWCSAGWASNNRWALLGSIRGSAQMISYEVALGLALMSMVLTYGTLDLQEMVRAQGGLLLGFLPAWGIFYQPLACGHRLHCRNGRVQARAVRSSGGGIRAHRRLLHRILGRQAGDVHAGGLRRGRGRSRLGHHAVSRRLAVPYLVFGRAGTSPVSMSIAMSPWIVRSCSSAPSR